MYWLLASLVALCIGALILLYMIVPQAKTLTLSAARYFLNLPSAIPSDSRLKLSWPRVSWLLLLQGLLLASIIAALLISAGTFQKDEDRQSVGLWFFVDTSASMSTVQDGITRSELAVDAMKDVFEAALASVDEADEGPPVCYRVSVFDQQLRHVAWYETQPSQIDSLASQLQARPLPANLNSPSRLVNEPAKTEDETCSASHVIVISDVAQPISALSNSTPSTEDSQSTSTDNEDTLEDGIALDLQGSNEMQEPSRELVWLDLADPQPNIGFDTIRTNQDPLSGAMSTAEIVIKGYLTNSPDAQVKIQSPNGKQTTQAIEWRLTSTNDMWQAKVQLESITDGQYLFGFTGLSDEVNSYRWDDQMVADIEAPDGITIDWQLADRTIPTAIGWHIDSTNPSLRVLPYDDIANPRSGSTPTLFVGPGSTKQSGQIQPVYYFYKSSPLLNDLNLDIIEQVEVPSVELPATFRGLLVTKDQYQPNNKQVWLAVDSQANAAYVPMLPSVGSLELLDDQNQVSALTFFNAVRWLLVRQELKPLYRLVAASELNSHCIVDNFEALAECVRSGNDIRLALHPEEGNTLHGAFGQDTVSEQIQDINWKATTKQTRTMSIWPYILLATSFLFVVERTIAAGRR